MMFIYVFTVWSIGSFIVNLMWQVCQWQVSKLINMVISMENFISSEPPSGSPLVGMHFFPDLIYSNPPKDPQMR